MLMIIRVQASLNPPYLVDIMDSIAISVFVVGQLHVSNTEFETNLEIPIERNPTNHLVPCPW